ncbi:helix-turn-helix domain-containing protein [Nocardiopsis synnemataformans]|uniref:helix-turn-helix domain-containing protein n=1 Tax=Nocardiopsis synnemataformans TaxID=61305 RepID=UPI003EB8A9C3
MAHHEKPNTPPGGQATLVSELNRLRSQAGNPSLRKIADLTGRVVSHTTINDIFHGRSVPRWTVVDCLVKALGGDPERFRNLWVEATAEKHHRFDIVAQEEVRARQIREYAPYLMPELLQTERYARAVNLYSTLRDFPEESELQVQHRIKRQNILEGGVGGPRVQFVLEEHVLRRAVGSRTILVEQLEHIQAVARRPKVMIYVVPTTALAHPGLDGGFLIFDLPNRGRMAYTKTRYTSHSATDREITDGYIDVWGELTGIAFAPDESAQLVARVARELEDQ